MIPKSFQIMGHKIRVKVTDSFDSDRVGEWNPKTCTIKLKPQLSSLQEQTYYHELVHCILDHLSYDTESENEQFVDAVSQCLYQALKTSRGSHE